MSRSCGAFTRWRLEATRWTRSQRSSSSREIKCSEWLFNDSLKANLQSFQARLSPEARTYHGAFTKSTAGPRGALIRLVPRHHSREWFEKAQEFPCFPASTCTIFWFKLNAAGGGSCHQTGEE